jgi:DNA-binding NtrC family response regulator
MSERILIVDDDPVQRRLLDNMVRKLGYEPLVAEGGDAAMGMLASAEGAGIDAIVLDLVMPDLDGLGVLARLREVGIGIPVIVQTAHGGIDNVVTAMRAGATDFVVKPVGAERLSVSLRNALAASALEGELARIKRSRAGTLSFKDIITRSPRMRAVLRTAEKAAASTIPVLIEGQSGVGKELIARAIHGSGERRAKPFVAVNCGAIPDNLVESILFGHEKGAFTGATERHTGKFVEAAGGTLFLDEVGELPLAAQVKLLRAIQEGEVEPVGARKPLKVDVRLISATNRDLIADVKAGRFREDLFYRLHVFPIAVPPLAERSEDITELTRHFLARFAAEEGKRSPRVSPEALALLAAYRWPGNVRQLENAVFRAVVMADGDTIGVDEFPQIAVQVAGFVAAASVAPDLAAPDSVPAAAALDVAVSAPPVAPSVAPSMAPNVAAPSVAPTSVAPTSVAPPATLEPPARGPALPLTDGNGDVRPLDELEADVIRFAITHYRGQMSEVARRLRIGRSTLYRKLDSLGLDARGDDADPGVTDTETPAL